MWPIDSVSVSFSHCSPTESLPQSLSHSLSLRTSSASGSSVDGETSLPSSGSLFSSSSGIEACYISCLSDLLPAVLSPPRVSAGMELLYSISSHIFRSSSTSSSCDFSTVWTSSEVELLDDVQLEERDDVHDYDCLIDLNDLKELIVFPVADRPLAIPSNQLIGHQRPRNVKVQRTRERKRAKMDVKRL